MSPCRNCEAKCCKYFALQIDTPRSKYDFEQIRWYLTHRDVSVFVDDRKWFLNIQNPCKYLDESNRCTIYEQRPEVCREHSPDTCEKETDEFGHEAEFRDISELDDYLTKRFRRKRNYKQDVR